VPLLKDCEVRDGIAVHDFGRRGCASLMAANGATMKQVQVHLQHSSISVTMALYTHLFPEDRKDAAARLDQILRHELRQAAGSETVSE
jgi:integrase